MHDKLVFMIFGLLMTLASGYFVVLAVKKVAAAPSDGRAAQDRIAVEQWRAEVEARRATMPKRPPSLAVRALLWGMLALPIVQIALAFTGHGRDAFLIALGVAMALWIAAAAVTGRATRNDPARPPMPPYPRPRDAKVWILLAVIAVAPFVMPPKGDTLIARAFVLDMVGLVLASRTGALIGRWLKAPDA